MKNKNNNTTCMLNLSYIAEFICNENMQNVTDFESHGTSRGVLMSTGSKAARARATCDAHIPSAEKPLKFVKEQLEHLMVHVYYCG